MPRKLLLLMVATLLGACKQNGGNPFSAVSPARPPSATSDLFYVSGSWSNLPGAPREVLALGLDGSGPEQLTTCAQAQTPCDMLQVVPSPDRSRVIAVRTTPDAAAGASVLYFMDLGRSVETILAARRHVDAADWSRDGSFLVYSSPVLQTGNEDLFTSDPNGSNEQNLTSSLDVRERHARIDPFGRTAVYERICTVASETCPDPGASRIYIYRETPITSGPADGPTLPGTAYRVGSDADPAYAPDASAIVFRRLTGTGNGGLGTWDILTTGGGATEVPKVIVSGSLYRGAPDWGTAGIVFVETDAAADRSELVLVQPDGSGRRVLRTEPASARMGAPRWID